MGRITLVEVIAAVANLAPTHRDGLLNPDQDGDDRDRPTHDRET